MKLFNYITLGAAFVLILTGFAIQLSKGESLTMARCYGLGTVIIFLVWMPVFLIYRFQKTKLLDHLDQNKKDNQQDTQ